MPIRYELPSELKVAMSKYINLGKESKIRGITNKKTTGLKVKNPANVWSILSLSSHCSLS